MCIRDRIITDKTENVIPVEEPEQDMIAVNEKAEQILSQARAQDVYKRQEILESNILVISKKGKVLGTGVLQGVEEINELIVDEVGGFICLLYTSRCV